MRKAFPIKELGDELVVLNMTDLVAKEALKRGQDENATASKKDSNLVDSGDKDGEVRTKLND